MLVPKIKSVLQRQTGRRAGVREYRRTHSDRNVRCTPSQKLARVDANMLAMERSTSDRGAVAGVRDHRKQLHSRPMPVVDRSRFYPVCALGSVQLLTASEVNQAVEETSGNLRSARSTGTY